MSDTPSATPMEMAPQLRLAQALVGLKWAEEVEVTTIRRRYEEERWRLQREYSVSKETVDET